MSLNYQIHRNSHLQHNIMVECWHCKVPTPLRTQGQVYLSWVLATPVAKVQICCLEPARPCMSESHTSSCRISAVIFQRARHGLIMRMIHAMVLQCSMCSQCSSTVHYRIMNVRIFEAYVWWCTCQCAFCGDIINWIINESQINDMAFQAIIILIYPCHNYGTDNAHPCIYFINIYVCWIIDGLYPQTWFVWWQN